MKKEITALILICTMIFALSGCKGETKQADSSFSESTGTGISEAATEPSETESDDITQSPTVTPDTEESDTDITASTVSEATTGQTQETQTSKSDEPVKSEAQNTQTPKPTENKTPEPEKETPKPTEQPPQEPETETPQEAFDIDYWISYAKSYAQSQGLTLNSEATECWDNPIGAGAHSVYLERDLQSRLNRYAKDADITDVWIWFESTGSGTYEIYIGYA